MKKYHSKLKMILRRLEGGAGDVYKTYVEETDDDANKNSALSFFCVAGISSLIYKVNK